VFGARVAQETGDLGCVRDGRLAAALLAIEQAEWVLLIPDATVITDLAQPGLVVRPERIEVRGATDRITDRVEAETQILKAQFGQERPQKVNGLRIDLRVRVSNRLDTKLPVLAVPARLRAM